MPTWGVDTLPSQRVPKRPFKILQAYAALSYILQAYNILMLIWLLSFIHYFGCMTIGGVCAGTYLDNSTVRVWSTLARICRYHLGTVAFGVFVPSLCLVGGRIICLNTGVLVNTVVHGDSAMPGRRRCKSLCKENVDKLLGLDKWTNLVFMMIKFGLVTLIFSAFAFAVFYNRNIIPFDLYLTFQPIHILILVSGPYVIVSNFLSIYKVAVETMLLRFLEDVNNQDAEKYFCHFKTSDLKQILEKKEHDIGRFGVIFQKKIFLTLDATQISPRIGGFDGG